MQTSWAVKLASRSPSLVGVIAAAAASPRTTRSRPASPGPAKSPASSKRAAWRCHAAGGRGPMSLATYEEARPWARAIKEEVMTRRMPKWHAVRGYGDFSNDPSLSPFEIALIAAWADGGAPRGTDGGRERPRRSRSAQARPAARRRARAPSALPCGEQPAARGHAAGRSARHSSRSVVRRHRGSAARRPAGNRRLDHALRSGVFDHLWLRVPLDSATARHGHPITEPRSCACSAHVSTAPSMTNGAVTTPPGAETAPTSCSGPARERRAQTSRIGPLVPTPSGCPCIAAVRS